MTKQADDKPEDTNKPWMIRDVPEKTRRTVKLFAAAHDMMMAEALSVLVDRGFKSFEEDPNISPFLHDSAAAERVQFLQELVESPDDLSIKAAKYIKKHDITPSRLEALRNIARHLRAEDEPDEI